MTDKNINQILNTARVRLPPKQKFDDSENFVPVKLQPLNQTRPERFPKIFDSAVQMQPKARRILSFGCATGDECQALVKRFPNAEIVGVDIDHYSITRARQKVNYSNVSFHDELRGLGQFDLVLCLMVLFCLENPVSQENFKKTLKSLDPHIADDGLLMLYTMEYDAGPILGKSYKPIRVWTHEHNRNKKQYFDGYYRKNPSFWRVFSNSK